MFFLFVYLLKLKGWGIINEDETQQNLSLAKDILKKVMLFIKISIFHDIFIDECVGAK